jgi:hypothetical protein
MESTYTLSIAGRIEHVTAESIGAATAIAITEHECTTAEVAVLAVDPPEPTLEDCLLPRGAIRYA